MKMISAPLFACCLTLTAFGQQLTLNGSLMTDEKAPVPATRISVHGIENTTDPKGQFKIVLSGDFSEGERVIIKVAKPGWVINYPLDGEWNLPNVKLQNIQTLDVIIVPKGSKALWTNARIEKHITKLSDEIARLKKEGDTPRPIDFSFYLREWAEQYGFTPEQVRAAFDEWAKSVEKSDDYRTLGLRAFYQNNFLLAADNFKKAAQKDEEQIKQIDEQRYRKTLDAYQNRKDAGNSFTNSYQFREALEQYNLAKLRLAELVPKDKHRYEQTQIEVLIGDAKQSLGNRVEGTEGNRLLSEAEDLYKQALAVFTREQFPQEWAGTMNNLGSVLGSQGERMMGNEGLKKLAEAEAAFRSALQVLAREQWPLYWAGTMNNLGVALRLQGERINGDESAKLLAEAVTAHRNELLVYTREQLPQQWALAQNNLGDALSSQGERIAGDKGMKRLDEAIAAFRSALLIRTREQSPQDWAATQNSLGIALYLRSERVVGDLDEAVAAHRNALLVYTREQSPQQWALAQNALGAVLSSQGERIADDEGVRKIAEAVVAYRNALLVYTRKQFPHLWAAIQNNLGTALGSQGLRTAGPEGAKLLDEAVDACRSALLVYDHEQSSQQWAMTQNNLGNLLKSQGVQIPSAKGKSLLADAVAAYRDALLVYTRERLPQQWVMTQTNLGDTYCFLGEWDKAAACYVNASSLNSGDKTIYQLLSGIYHVKLFEYELAFKLHQKWLTNFPDDLSAMINFAETHFTTGRFAEAEPRIATLLANPKVEGSTALAMRVIDVANSLALNKANQVPAKLDATIQVIANQSADFKLIWAFDSTLHFIGQNEKLAPYRDWLRQLFGAVQAANRDAIVKGLREAKASFKW